MNGIKNKRIALDTNIFIYSFEGNPHFLPLVKKIFLELERNQFTAITSIISLIETLSFPMSHEKIAIIKQGFLEIPNITIYDINQIIAAEAARIRRIYGFRLPDAIQLATAIYANADIFITNDQLLRGFKELKVVLLTDF